MPKRKTIAPGDRFGKLTIIKEVDKRKEHRCFLTKCDCGNEKEAVLKTLLNGGTKSCGCLSRDVLMLRNTKHGFSKKGMIAKEYTVWLGMIRRCGDEKAQNFQYYGARNISLCSEWRASFTAFLEDMGPMPSPKHSIDRINNDLGYSPQNCRWLTHREQCRNKRNNVSVSIDGKTMLACDAAAMIGCNRGALSTAIKNAKKRGLDSYVFHGVLITFIS